LEELGYSNTLSHVYGYSARRHSFPHELNVTALGVEGQIRSESSVCIKAILVQVECASLVFGML